MIIHFGNCTMKIYEFKNSIDKIFLEFTTSAVRVKQVVINISKNYLRAFSFITPGQFSHIMLILPIQ